MNKKLLLIALLAVPCMAAKKFVKTPIRMDGKRVCITLDKKRDAGLCMTAPAIQRCMDRSHGVCRAQLVEPGNEAVKATIFTCGGRHERKCDPKEFMQYHFIYTEKGAFTEVIR